MKKYILLIILFCFGFYMAAAGVPKDSIWVYNGDTEIPDMEELQKSMTELQKSIADSYSGYNFDTSKFANMKQDLDSLSKVIAETVKKDFGNLKGLKKLNKNFKFDFNFNPDRGQWQDQKPARVEKKSFQNISEIEFFHKYGNIVVQESNSNQVDLEIHYFDKGDRKGTATIETNNKLLTITTSNTGGNNRSSARIDYIISIPKNILLNIDLKYGNVTMGRYEGIINTDMLYTNLKAQALTNRSSVIKCKYGNVNIDEVRDIKLIGSYSNFKIKKAEKIDIEGKYNKCNFDNVEVLATGKSSSYSDVFIGTVGSMTGEVRYADLTIDNLVSDLDVDAAYGDINIKGISSKVKNITIKARYTDIVVSVPDNLSMLFELRRSLQR